MADLSSLVTRLEAVATRLEGGAGGKGGGTAGGSAVKRLEEVTIRLEAIKAVGRKSGGGGTDAMDFVDEYNTVLQGKLQKYYELSRKIGGEVAEHAKIVESAFQVQAEFIKSAGTHKAPTSDVFQKAIKPIADKVEEIQSFCDKRRGNPKFNHFMTVKEGIGCLGWVTVSPKPAPYVKEMFDQALFYGNRVLKEFKGKDDTHVEWMRAFTGAIMELQAYVKEYHTTGLAWNPDGPPLAAPAGGPPPPPPGGAPPPPPPPAVLPPDDAPPKKDEKELARGALLADLSKGADVTKGLRKVTDDMKTHKNPALRGSSVVKATDVKPAAKAAPKYGAAAAAVKKPPKLELQGKKWIVEYQEGQSNLQITDTNPKQTIYVFKCTKSTLVVKGKCNSIVLDNCKKMALVFDDVIASCEIINCQGMQVQVTGKCPTVSIDKTDGCQVFLSKDSLKCEIVTAKSSEMNICIPKVGGVEGDYTEHAVPEQFKTVWNGKALSTEASDINQ